MQFVAYAVAANNAIVCGVACQEVMGVPPLVFFDRVEAAFHAYWVLFVKSGKLAPVQVSDALQQHAQ